MKIGNETSFLYNIYDMVWGSIYNMGMRLYYKRLILINYINWYTYTCTCTPIEDSSHIILHVHILYYKSLILILIIYIIVLNEKWNSCDRRMVFGDWQFNGRGSDTNLFSMYMWTREMKCK